MNTLFYIFSSFQLLSGIMVIQSRNPVHSVLFLILVFFNAAGLLLLLGLDFFAMIFLVVYVGGIAVLFLFVVMMLNIQYAEINENRSRYLPVLGFLGLLFLLEIFLIVDNDLIPLRAVGGVDCAQHNLYSGEYGEIDHASALIPANTSRLADCQPVQDISPYQVDCCTNSTYLQWSNLIDTSTNIEAIGFYIYTVYFVFFLLASLILLVAMIGAIVCTMHKTTQIKRQQIFQQNSREFAKTYRKFS